jgi:phosphohistidine phosphatase
MKLYIMRHGPAEDEASSGRDEDRALTASGRDRVRIVAQALLQENEAPHALFTSPLVRALQTAEIVAAVTKLAARGERVETRREIAPGGDAHAFVDELLKNKRKRAMLVGHEPDLTSLVEVLLGRPLPWGMQKAMVVGLTMEEGTTPATLRFVLDPKTLAWSKGTSPS